MLRAVREFCVRHPWFVVLVILIITAGAITQIKEKLYFEGDVTKFLPGDLKAVKANDYSQKNFNYQERVLIGIEYPTGSVLEPDVLRTIEAMVLALKELKATKVFESQLTGKTERISLPIGIDTEDINSIANLEDTILDRATGSVIAGSVIEKLKNDFDIQSAEGMEERLPENDEDLNKLIPGLKKRVMDDRIFRGNFLAEDLHAAVIQVPMIRKWDYKSRFAQLELETALDPQRLKNRFQGNDSTFPFQVIGKTYDGLTIDDAFINKHSKKVGNRLMSFLSSELEEVIPRYPQLRVLLDSEPSPKVLQEIMRLTRDRDFFLDPEIRGWEQFTNNLYEFTLDVIDPLSRENLEFKFYDVRDIYNLKNNYELITELAADFERPDLNFHIAGQPVTIALISYMMQTDMRRMVPIALGVVFLVLLLSFRNAAGLMIPLLTVVITVIWTLAIMAISGTPLSISTTSMPIVLLAVGTAYGIHLLNRYFSDIQSVDNRPAVIADSFKQVGPAVFMAAVTTMAGFGSLYFSSLPNIRHFGVFSATGVAIALLLSFTLTPAILMLVKSGISRKDKGKQSNTRPSDRTGIGTAVAKVAYRHPRMFLAAFLLVTVLAVGGTLRNHFEGDPIINFKQDNPLSQADQFINSKLTGTNMISLIFRFRDQIKLEDPVATEQLRQRIAEFNLHWQRFVDETTGGAFSPLAKLGNDLVQTAKAENPDPSAIMDRLTLVADMLNEDYAPESGEVYQESDMDALNSQNSNDESAEITNDSMGDLDDLGDLGDDLETLGEESEGLDSVVEAGLEEIALRLSVPESERASLFEALKLLRNRKGKPSGLIMQRAFNQLGDLFVVDVKQPIVLHKLEELYAFLNQLQQPVVVKGGQELLPTGLISSPVDLIRKVYKTFYHDDNNAFDRLPDTEKDGIEDITLTDRSIIGVTVNQAQSANKDLFDSLVTADHKEFQMQIMIRSGSSKIIEEYVKTAFGKTTELFPENDPYIERILVGGLAPQLKEVTSLLMDSQLKSIAGCFLLVWLITFFIFRSAMGGLFSLIPLGFTVILNFGMMYLVGWPITQGTVIVSSIAIGIGVDYTIHFLERFKLQLRQGDSLDQAYFNTIRTSGKAIIINAVSVALGFMVLVFSEFIPVIALGVLMTGTMVFSTIGALIILPVLIILINPSFIKKQNENNHIAAVG